MRRKKRTLAATALLVLALLSAARADEPHAVSFRVERGDTFSNLFGSDWQKAYEQNRLTVFRRGRPVTSPDILLEGMVVRVSSDVGLTPRAVARCGALSARREHLAARLAALEGRLSGDPRAQGLAADTRRLLEDDLRFAADVDFAARQVEHLESLSRSPTLPEPLSQGIVGDGTDRGRHYLLAALLLMAAALGALSLRRRRLPPYPAGAARYNEALADLKGTFRSAGQKL